MPYLSEIQHRRIVDRGGALVGKLIDVAVIPKEQFPAVQWAIVGGPDGERTLRWTDLEPAGRQYRLADDAGGANAELPPEALRLARDLLDKQIVDTHGAKVVRVNDLQLEEKGGQLLLVGADVGLRGLLRRVGGEQVAERVAALVGRKLPRGIIPWHLVEPLEASQANVRLTVPHQKLALLHPADIADIVEEMDPDEAVDLLQDLSAERREELIELMEQEEGDDVAELLAYPEDSAGGIMTTDFVALPRELTAGQAIERLRELQPDPAAAYYLYVIDAEGRLDGNVSLRDLVVAPPETSLAEIMNPSVLRVEAHTDKEDVAALIAKYDLLALPIVDARRVLLGTVTVDDVVELMLPRGWKKRSLRSIAR